MRNYFGCGKRVRSDIGNVGDVKLDAVIGMERCSQLGRSSRMFEWFTLARTVLAGPEIPLEAASSAAIRTGIRASSNRGYQRQPLAGRPDTANSRPEITSAADNHLDRGVSVGDFERVLLKQF